MSTDLILVPREVRASRLIHYRIFMLQATIGAALIPVFRGIAQVVNELTRAFQSIPVMPRRTTRQRRADARAAGRERRATRRAGRK